MKIINSCIVTAFSDKTIGTKVIDRHAFYRFMLEAVKTFDFASQRVPGQGVIQLPDEAVGCISGGIGRHTGNPSHYCVRKHWSGQVQAFLIRDMALQPKGVSVVVNTREAYLADPDVVADSHETWRINEEYDATHVLVTILTNYDDKAPPLPLTTFVRNLAGANNEALAWTADEIRAKAKEVQEYHERWGTVAD